MRPQSAPTGLLKSSGEPSGTHFEARKLEKPTFEHDRSRDSLEKRLRNDFRSIFEACAQAWELEKPIKTLCFPMFFAIRCFFERPGWLERQSNENAPKSTPWGTHVNTKSTQIAPRSALRVTSRVCRAPVERLGSVDSPDDSARAIRGAGRGACRRAPVRDLLSRLQLERLNTYRGAHRHEMYAFRSMTHTTTNP